MQLLPELGVSVPVGKDSLSMRTRWTDPVSGDARQVTSPVSLVVTAFAALPDVRGTLDPAAARRLGPRCSSTSGPAVTASAGRSWPRRPAPSAARCPTSTTPQRLSSLVAALAELRSRGVGVAYHDRSDGGLWAAVCEMAFAGAVGVGARRAVGRPRSSPRSSAWCSGCRPTTSWRSRRSSPPTGWPRWSRRWGAPPPTGGCACSVAGERVLDESVRDLAQAWDEVSWRIAGLRDNPACAEEEHAAFGADDDPGLVVAPSFDPTDDVAAPYLNLGVRPKVAILREQGVNSHVETAFAFDRAGFDTYDVHMTDLQAGPVRPRRRRRPRGLRWLLVRRHPRRRRGVGAIGALQRRGSPRASTTSSTATTPSASASATAARCSPRSPSSSPGPTRGRGSPATAPSSTRLG